MRGPVTALPRGPDFHSVALVKGQGQTLKTLKSNVSKTVRDREKVSIEVRYEVVYGLSCEYIYDPM